MNYYQIITDNFDPAPDSFVSMLRSKGLIDIPKLEIYLEAINEASKHKYTKERCEKISRIISYILHLIICHHNPDDGFTINNFDEVDIAELTSRLLMVEKAYFSGDPLEEIESHGPLRRDE